MGAKISRREALKFSLFGAAGLALPLPFSGGYSIPGAAAQAVAPGNLWGFEPFTQALYIPPVAKSYRLGDSGGLGSIPGELSPEAVAYRGVTSPAHPDHRSATQYLQVAHGIAPEFGTDRNFQPSWNRNNDNSGSYRTHEQQVRLYIEETKYRFFGDQGPQTFVFAYRDDSVGPGEGRIPGPTIVANYREPTVVRNYNTLTRDRKVYKLDEAGNPTNELADQIVKDGKAYYNSTAHDHETSIHLHGGHAPAHADGYPDFYCLAGEGRDYFYPNCPPRETVDGFAPHDRGNFDTTWIPSTLWYHDHAMDVTGFNVARGLAGFYIVRSAVEDTLADAKVIPSIEDKDGTGGPLDIGLALGDQLFDKDGQIYYDWLDHNGRLGNVPTVNGVIQPKHNVQRRKYRLRILNASNSRYMEIRLSNNQPMHIVGTDSWLLPKAVEVKRFNLAPGQRQDVIVDFRLDGKNKKNVFLENILLQEDGRKGKKIEVKSRIRMMKFVVEDAPLNDTVVGAPLKDGDIIRGFKGTTYDGTNGTIEIVNGKGVPLEGEWAPITKDEVVKTRHWEFSRSYGSWVVNDKLYNPRRADAVPQLGVGAEKWVVENGGGGWWHPFHMHLEGMQMQSAKGVKLREERRYNCDLFNLEGGVTATFFMKFRSFTGPFVFHCHAIEHEDMRMMATHNPTPSNGVTGPVNSNNVSTAVKMDGESKVRSEVSGVETDCIDLEHDKFLYFDEAGDFIHLDGRGVGFLECEFDMKKKPNRG